VLPLGSDPVLVTDVDASPLPSGRIRLSFNERLPNAAEPRTFHVELDPKLMQGLMHLLDQALQRSQWQEPFSAPVAIEEAALDDDEAAQRKPRYLN
jgi:hypothetical protein